MYRVRLRRTADGLGLVLSDRAVARLCLEEGDELVITEIVRNSAVDAAVDPDVTELSDELSIEPTPIRQARPLRPVREPFEADRADDTAETAARDLAAFRRLVR